MSITIDGTNGITQSGPSKANAYLDAAGGNTATINSVLVALASQAQAQAGTDNTTLMTPLRAAEAVAALGGLTGIKVQVFGSSSTYTPTAGYKYAIAILTSAGQRGAVALSGYGGQAGGTVFGVYDISAGTSMTLTVGQGSTTNTGLDTTLSQVALSSAYVAGGAGDSSPTATLTRSKGGRSFWGGAGTGGPGGYASGGTTYYAGSAGIAVILEFK